MPIPSLFSAIVAAGIPYDSHESDLYIPDTPAASAVLALWPLEASNARPFSSEIDGKPWLDIPFAFLPYWEARARTATRPQS